MTSSGSVSFPVLVEVVLEYNTEGLIKFLRNEETLKDILLTRPFLKDFVMKKSPAVYFSS